MITVPIEAVLCCDRYDLASPTRELLVKSVSLQAGTICVLFFLCGLLVSLIMTPLDERITLLDSSAFTNATVPVHAHNVIHYYNSQLTTVQTSKAHSHRLLSSFFTNFYDKQIDLLIGRLAQTCASCKHDSTLMRHDLHWLDMTDHILFSIAMTLHVSSSRHCFKLPVEAWVCMLILVHISLH